MLYPKGIYQLPSPLSRNFKDVLDKKDLIKLGQAEKEWIIHLLMELAEHFDGWVGVDLQRLSELKELSESLKITAHFIITMRVNLVKIIKILRKKNLIIAQISRKKILIFPKQELIDALERAK